ncbi:GspE/PulE/PilB domain-containing protein, partial [Paraburkholderia humisilvae]
MTQALAQAADPRSGGDPASERGTLPAAGERAAPSPLAARLVPYSFARTGQILVAHQHADGLEVWISERTSDAALAEVARNLGVLSVVRMPADELAQAINAAYSRQDGSAAQVVGEV